MTFEGKLNKMSDLPSPISTMPIKKIVENQTRLRNAANELLKVIGDRESAVNFVKPQIDSLILQVQRYITECASRGDMKEAEKEAKVQKNVIYDEKQRIAMRMEGFNQKDNSAWFELTKRFGQNIKRNELMNIAQVLANAADIKLDRDAKRRKSVLLKWFDEHWARIRPLLDYVVIEGNENNDYVLDDSESPVEEDFLITELIR